MFDKHYGAREKWVQFKIAHVYTPPLYGHALNLGTRIEP